MADTAHALRVQLERQVAHWSAACTRLALDDLAGAEAWSRLERYLGLSLRRHLQGVIDRLAADARVLVAMQAAAGTNTALAELQRQMLKLRSRYLRAETTLDFFADAINSRTSPELSALLRACDTLAHRSMSLALDPLGLTAPVALTYIDKGLGASILKAGLRLWDGGEVCPVAAIKITRHNLLRPTSLIHEAGHQVAHVAGWNDELAAVLADGLRREGATADTAHAWSGWASEIAADAFAFVHTGYASVAALHDVVAGEADTVWRHLPGDPHPVSWLRVMLGVQSCRHCWGAGPWDDLAEAWQALHPIARAPQPVRALAEASLPLLDAVVRLTLFTPMRAFKGQPLAALLPPDRVSPRALAELDTRIGPALYTSAHWLWSEPLRILGLTGLRLAEAPERLNTILDLQQQSMLRLGGALQAA